MNSAPLILMAEAVAVYLLVLWSHSLRHRAGLAPFYALLGGVTAVMSWVTDAGVAVEFGGLTFMIGSTVFYTALLLGVFVVYVFDGPAPTRIAILTVAGVSVLAPVIAAVLHVQAGLAGEGLIPTVPVPNLRINAASLVATVADLLFLAMAWECLGNPKLRIHLGFRAFLTLLGVMWLDVLLFATGAFAGTPPYLGIMGGTFASRLFVSVFAWPFLYIYLNRQNRRLGLAIENRPVLAILGEVAAIRGELTMAQIEIERRKRAEAERERLIASLESALARVRCLEGLLPVCSSCRKVRIDSERPDEPDRWVSLEDYVRECTSTQFTHGVCEDCMRRLYPEMSEDVLHHASRQRNHQQPPLPSGPQVSTHESGC